MRIERRAELNTDLIRDARLAREYLDIAEVLIMALDENFVVTMINQKGANILGYPKDEIIGKNFMENFLPLKIKNEIKQVAKGIIKNDKEFKKEYENPILNKNGEERLIAWKNTQLKDENGKYIGILTSGEDITDLREQQTKILHKSRLEQMGEMLSMIAHQWRQPLAAISSVSNSVQMQMLVNKEKLQGELQPFANSLELEMQKINTYVQGLSRTLHDFQNFYSVHKEFENYELEDVLEAALNILQSALSLDGIKVLKNYTQSAECRVIYNELLQVVLNILQNSRENFLKNRIENPCIEIRVKENMISIADNGGGIEEKIIEKVFDPYFSTKSDVNGTGLGLYMSKVIIEEHHKGRLSMRNTNDGTEFIIELQK